MTGLSLRQRGGGSSATASSSTTSTTSAAAAAAALPQRRLLQQSTSALNYGLHEKRFTTALVSVQKHGSSSNVTRVARKTVSAKKSGASRRSTEGGGAETARDTTPHPENAPSQTHVIPTVKRRIHESYKEEVINAPAIWQLFQKEKEPELLESNIIYFPPHFEAVTPDDALMDGSTWQARASHIVNDYLVRPHSLCE